MGTDTNVHLADAKSMLDSRGLYEGQTFHGVNPLLLVEKIIRQVPSRRARRSRVD